MPEENHQDSFSLLRNRMLNDLILATAIAAIPALAISLSRITLMGFQPFMAVQILLVAFLWLTRIFARQLPYLFRTVSLLVILWIATFAALSQMGPASDSKVFMVIFAFTSILFLDSRKAWMMVTGIILCMALFGIAAVNHWFTFNLDYQVYAYHPLSWLLTTWNMGIFSTVIAFMGWRMIQSLRMQSDKALESSNRLQKISQRLPGVVYQFKMNSAGFFSFPYTSEGVNDLFHVTPQQVKDDASALFAATHPDDRELLLKSITESAKNMTPWRVEYRTLSADGSIRWLTGDSNPQLEADGSILWHGFITDITQRKIEERIKDEFVATVSHELRTPLTSIRGSIKLINSGLLVGKEAEQKKMLNIAENNSERLLNLIEDLLNIEKLKTGQLELNITQFDLSTFLQESIAENLPYALQCNNTLELITCDKINAKADQPRLKQVLANLISNACKFSPVQSAVHISATSDKDKFIITVTDFGAGIPLEFQTKLFDQFTQADSSDTRQFGGTGLGLSIAKKIVELHQGEISFTTEVNVGTSFIVKLPI